MDFLVKENVADSGKALFKKETVTLSLMIASLQHFNHLTVSGNDQ